VQDHDQAKGPPQLQNDRYKLSEQVGSGTIADVWRATDTQAHDEVAIKIMRAEELDLEDVQRMAQEVEILKKLHHPCIVRLFGTGTTLAGKPYVIMEWVDGIDLRARLKGDLQITHEDAADIINQLCSALADGYEHGVVHRDLKPENVLLCAPEHLAVKVVDFGMAKLLEPQAPELTFDSKVFGTPQYMAPERVMGDVVTGAADVYSVAVIAFEMLTGRRPFDAQNPVEVMQMHVTAPPPPLEVDLPAAVERVVHAGLEKKPSARPGAREFAHQLTAALGI
jgi:serine/threonine-protein kinase